VKLYRELFIGAALLIVSIFIYLNLLGDAFLTRARLVFTIDEQTLDSDASELLDDGRVLQFNLESDEGAALFETQATGDTAAYEALTKPIYYEPDQKRLLPENFVKKVRLQTKLDDKQDEFLKAQGFKLTKKHYRFQQLIDGVPVFGSSILINFDESRVYKITGNLLTDETVPAAKLTIGTAVDLAKKAAGTDAKEAGDFTTSQTQEVIFNKKLLGIGSDNDNYRALSVVVSLEEGSYTKFSTRYFVDLVTGTILHRENLIAHALNRTIHDCTSASGQNASCPQARSEGAAPVNVGDVDRAYDLFGEIYNTLSPIRDSYDNQGAPLNVLVNIQNSATRTCPNAQWVAASSQWEFCTGMVTRDITAHEYSHAIIKTTSDLALTGQSGALQESIADVAGYGFDSDDWSIGEDSTAGAFRHLDDPTKLNHPDRLFSPNYFCGTQDQGGIHVNGGVFSKAFYLMTEGGSFNGCTTTGLGKEKTILIVYRATTTYLNPTANYNTIYTAMNQACADLYTAASADCQTVMDAMQATEMDQQQLNDQQGAKCMNIQPQAPACALGGQPSPTSEVTPGLTETPTETPPVAEPTPTTTVIEPTQTPIPSPTTIPTFDAKVDLSLIFQGIVKKPLGGRDKMKVKLTFSEANTSFGTSIDREVEFTADNNAVWHGSTVLEAIPVGTDFEVNVLGPRHLARVVCDENPREFIVNNYACSLSSKAISIKDSNNLDFSGITILTGDLPNQDGQINSYDLSLVRNNLDARAGSILEAADLNHDGIVNSQDFSLILAAMAAQSNAYAK
jgi:Zn-dependent metalloprotease